MTTDQKTYWVYILSSRKNGALYIGVTSDIGKRIYEHREKIVKGHTHKYDINKLVFAEQFSDPDSAHAAEKKIKRWRRKWKDDLIESMNPEWRDLYDTINI